MSEMEGAEDDAALQTLQGTELVWQKFRRWQLACRKNIGTPLNFVVYL